MENKKRKIIEISDDDEKDLVLDEDLFSKRMKEKVWPRLWDFCHKKSRSSSVEKKKDRWIHIASFPFLHARKIGPSIPTSYYLQKYPIEWYDPETPFTLFSITPKSEDKEIEIGIHNTKDGTIYVANPTEKIESAKTPPILEIRVKVLGLLMGWCIDVHDILKDMVTIKKIWKYNCRRMTRTDMIGTDLFENYDSMANENRFVMHIYMNADECIDRLEKGMEIPLENIFIPYIYGTNWAWSKFDYWMNNQVEYEVTEPYGKTIENMVKDGHIPYDIANDNKKNIPHIPFSQEIPQLSESIASFIDYTPSIVQQYEQYSKSIDDNLIKFSDNLNTGLYDYQIKAVKWMLMLENTLANREISHKSTMVDVGSLEYMYQMKESDDFSGNIEKEEFGIYASALMNRFFLKEKRDYISIKGGMLCDEMGLGKSLMILYLIFASNQISDIPSPKLPPPIDRYTGTFMYHSRATLILCPGHICLQWKSQIEEHFTTHFMEKTSRIIVILKQGQIKYSEKQSPTQSYKTFSFKQLCDADIVIMAFNALLPSATRKKKHSIATETRKPTLKDIHFHRIVLDEGHDVTSPPRYG